MLFLAIFYTAEFRSQPRAEIQNGDKGIKGIETLAVVTDPCAEAEIGMLGGVERTLSLPISAA